MRKLFVLIFGLTCFHTVYPQGCIMIRNISGFGQYNITDHSFSNSSWQVNIVSRYFKSFREFKDDEDQKNPEGGINHVFSTDFSVSRFFDKGYSINFSLPLNVNSRSTTMEHGGKGTPRYTTHSFGVGDVRLTAYKWILPPSVNQKGNVQIGLGLKLPTGDYKYQDYFHRNDSVKVSAPVNASIQLGDGGTGLIAELNGFYVINKTVNLYGNIYYLANPRDQNGTSTTYGRAPTSTQLQTGSEVNSVPDQYSLRGGMNLNFKKFSYSAGVRWEGITVNDFIGNSNGSRRSGYNLSFEPGLIYSMKKVSLYSYVPIIIGRKTKQTVPDKLQSEITGNYEISSGGFANYLVFLGVLFKL